MPLRKSLVSLIALAAVMFTTSAATQGQEDRILAGPLVMKVLHGEDSEQEKQTTEAASTEAKNERKLRILRMQRMPVAVTAVRNLQAETWYKDLEIEVKNISDKPIYHLSLLLTFPDDYSDRSKIALISLEFGSPQYLDIRAVGNASDPHLKPGEAGVLKISEWYWEILRRRQERFPERLRSFVMSIGFFSFGDKTGFKSGPGWADYRDKKP